MEAGLLGRSLAHLIETVASVELRGIGFRSITEAIDTITPGGRLVFQLFWGTRALEQFERDLIRIGTTISFPDLFHPFGDRSRVI